MAKYGTFMTPDLFGSKFFRGNVVTKHEENPLHFLMGTVFFIFWISLSSKWRLMRRN